MRMQLVVIVLLLFDFSSYTSSGTRTCMALRFRAEGGKSTQGHQNNHNYRHVWEEVVPATINNNEEQQQQHVGPSLPTRPFTKIKGRRWISFARHNSLFGRGQQDADGDSGKKPETKKQPHPLRTDEFRLEIQWRRIKKRRQHTRTTNCNNVTLELQFADNGFVRATTTTATMNNNSNSCAENNNTSESLIGRWSSVQPGSLTFQLPRLRALKPHNSSSSSDHDDNNCTDGGAPVSSLDFYCFVHLNPFGDQPKVSRGIILERRNVNTWFRPVVGTFTGKGIGQDTTTTTTLSTSTTARTGEH